MKKVDEIREKLTTKNPQDYFSMLEFVLVGWIKIAEPPKDQMSKEELFNDEFYTGYIYGLADSALQGSSLELTNDLYGDIIGELFCAVFKCSKQEGIKKLNSVTPSTITKKIQQGMMAGGNEWINFVNDKTIPGKAIAEYFADPIGVKEDDGLDFVYKTKP
tara:strand:+ start:14 stop:496 length:483 start_codon:yes stop_codon:yes gene_type:complete